MSKDLYGMSLYKISVWNVCKRSIEEFSWQELCKRPVGRSLYRSLEEVTHFVRACAVEMHFNIFTRATLYANLHEKCRAPEPRRTLRASLRSRNALMHFNISDFTRATYTEIYRKIPQPSATQNRGADFVRACEVEMHFNIFTRAISHRNLQEKCRAPEPRCTLCASLRGRNAFQHFHKIPEVWWFFGQHGPQTRSLCMTFVQDHCHSDWMTYW